MAALSQQAIQSGDLTDLVSSSSSATVYPTDDTILAVLQARFRADLPYTRVGASNLIVVNPYKTLANVNDTSAQEYEERSYKDTSLPLPGGPPPLPPHLFDLAARVYLLMRDGTSLSLSYFGKILLSSVFLSKLDIRRFGQWSDRLGQEFQLSIAGRICAAKVLTYALDKSRLNRLSFEERTYHVFYQFLAGATPDERDRYMLEDLSDYALLASDDNIAMDELRASMKTLGFKPKHQASIFIRRSDARDVSAYVSNMPVLDQVARLLGIASDELSETLTNRTSYVRKELYTVAQRDQLMRDLYAILFAFVAPPPSTQIILPTRVGVCLYRWSAPLLSPHGQAGFDEFCINFANEVFHSYVLRHTFEDSVGYNGQLTGDGIRFLRSRRWKLGLHRDAAGSAVERTGSPEAWWDAWCHEQGIFIVQVWEEREKKDEELLQDLVSKFGIHASFVSGGESMMFGINHFAGRKDCDALDSAFVSLLRNSSDPFVSKLMSGPSLATERHSKDEGSLFKHKYPSKVYPITTQLNHSLSEIMANLDKTQSWTVSCIRPNDSGSSNSFDRRRVKAQVRSLLLPDLVARRKADYIVDIEHAAFCDRYVPTMRGSEAERIRQCAQANGWQEGVDYVVGHRMIWLSYMAWKMVEDVLRAGEKERKGSGEGADEDESVLPDDATEYTHQDASFATPATYYGAGASDDNLLLTRTGTNGTQYRDPNPAAGYGQGGLSTPRVDETPAYSEQEGWGSEWDKKGDSYGSPPGQSKEGGLVVKEAPNAVEEVPSSRSRRNWLAVVWLLTFWIPDFALSGIGRMKRPDVRLAWREKLTIFSLILLLNGIVLFYILIFGQLLCPDSDKAWNVSELSQHQGHDDFYVAVAGKVYDVSKWIWGQHSDIQGEPSNSAASLDVLAGQDLTDYFPVPLSLACPGLVSASTVQLRYANFTPEVTQAQHTSGPMQGAVTSALHNDDWYTSTFLPKMKTFYKGALVYTKSDIYGQANDADSPRYWAIWNQGVYDLSDYLNTVSVNGDATSLYQFLDTDLSSLFQQQPGQDLTSSINTILDGMNSTYRDQNVNCINNAFYVGEVDFRKTARCQVQNYMLLVFSCILMASMGMKFLAALQLSARGTPEMLDKFVICQVPCYTEGEESLRRTIDSLSALNYDDKRKLIFIICDGNIIGTGNDRTTPRIVLDILGVDPKLDPEPLLFKSVGEGSKALNYGKVYSGLYEFEGHVVPYIVVVKVGKPTERTRPGNRGKRDSQILMMQYLNRVHFDTPMTPMELEIYHQMRNVIGIDPAFYEYIFTVDADTSVTPDSLNRLVACAADDSSIIGICGETKVDNEEGSWWTMIQVYEYYISHHLSKAFESLFGSVSCLPGCFSLYRIRTADKGRPIIISNRIIEEYSEPIVDTLHKKNLFSLGEDRFLTTLLLKHFPTYRTKFTPDAIARTIAPESWRVLFSQRRRWINSTVHNLCELVFLKEMCGFCCFSMRFFVFIDLLGTLLFYLIIVVSIGKAAFPLISIIMLACVYGLQAIIFLIKREFMLIGWMVVYILSYPVYSFFMPLYSFWCMDDFSWGNTRLVIGEGANKKVIVNDDEKFDESMIPLKKFSEYEAEAWEAGSRQSDETGYDSKPHSQVRSQQPHSRAGSPRSFQQPVQTGDFYRDTNVLSSKGSNPNLRGRPSQSNMSQYGGQPPMMSQYSLPQMPFMPFGGGPGSVSGSEYGGHMPMTGPMGYQNTASVYGMMPTAPRNTVMTNLNMFSGEGSVHGSQGGFAPPGPIGGVNRPMSTFSLATSVNPFAGPSMNPDPSDEDLNNALRNYLSTQDLMTVTKKTARDAIQARFPKADLGSRRQFLNDAIDKILSQS
ncbi:chitin synthase [Amylocystis lapponica]|nr:chitin synthase [Amylocystis lapponica]